MNTDTKFSMKYYKLNPRTLKKKKVSIHCALIGFIPEILGTVQNTQISKQIQGQKSCDSLNKCRKGHRQKSEIHHGKSPKTLGTKGAHLNIMDAIYNKSRGNIILDRENMINGSQRCVCIMPVLRKGGRLDQEFEARLRHRRTCPKQ